MIIHELVDGSERELYRIFETTSWDSRRAKFLRDAFI